MVDPLHLMRPESDWPVLLAGPILRRVTRRSVAVFVATSEVVAVTLTIHDRVDATRTVLATSAPRATTWLGTRLHVCVVEATGLDLEPGHVYGYDISLDNGVDVVGIDHLVNANVPLGYRVGDLPGFVVPGPLDSLRVIHGSCRKPHGCVHARLTDPDMLPMVDRLVQDSHTDPWRRPQQLFLTGDQIYSDDVPAALLAALTHAGGRLVTWDEALEDNDGADVRPDDPDIAPGKRSVWLDGQGVKVRPPTAEGWEDYSANHLLFFGEWCAMYLYMWSPELWPRLGDLAADVQAAHPGRFHHLPDAADVWTGSPDTTTPTMHLAQHLVLVRRALANVATYMVFDDHDVTDDWFLNGAVEQRLRGRGEVQGPVGRRLMRNGLAAHALFQHWGNQPQDFATGTRGGELLALFHGPSGSPPIANDPTAADGLLDVGPEALGPDAVGDRLQWDFEEVFDQHRVIALDTRTWRGHPGGPRAPDEQALLDALGDRAVFDLDWGPEALDEVADVWRNAAEGLSGGVQALPTRGADLLRAVAELGRLGEADFDDIGTEADATRAAMASLLDDIASGVDSQGHVWAAEILRAASQATMEARHDAVVDGGETVVRVAAACHEAEFTLESGLSAHLRELDGDQIVVEVAVLATVETIARLSDATAGFLEGSIHALPRATRKASELARAWDTLAFDHASAVSGPLEEADELVLHGAALAAADARASLVTSALSFSVPLDPVWGLVEDPSARMNTELISAEALQFQVHDRVRNEANRRELTLVVSAAPVFGHTRVELLQDGQRRVTTEPEPAETADDEPWSGNGPAMHRFLDALAPLGSVALLSGDVHYGFSRAVDYVASDATPARVLQLTSSSLKNALLKTKLLAGGDEVIDVPGGVLRMPFDWLDSLPLQEAWDQFSEEVRALLPSRDQALQTIGEDRAAAQAQATGGSGVGTWLSGLADLVGLTADLDDAATDTGSWTDVEADWANDLAEQLQAIEDRADDPHRAYTGTRLSVPAQMPASGLDLAKRLGMDPRHLPESTVTVLRDHRGVERADDSPTLAGRLATRVDGDLMALSGRTTVGCDTVAMITTQTDHRGRFLTHEFYWFPIDEPAQVFDPEGVAAQFRDDWITTRHSGGMTVGMPPDGGRVGAPAPIPPQFQPDVWFHLEVTSPGHLQRGPTRVHGISDVGPRMPDVEVHVTLVGLPASISRTKPRDVRLECRYSGGNRDDVLYLPGPTADDWTTLDPGLTVWRPSFPHAWGGDLRVFARDIDGEATPGQTEPGEHAIWGRNPSKADVRDHANAPTYVEVVFHRESQTTQFASSAAVLGPHVPGPATVLRSPKNSFGIAQLDIPPPTVEQLWNWQENVEEAVVRLEGFRQDALTYQRQVQEGLAWTAATGQFDPSDPDDPPPPDEGVAHPEATNFTEDQKDLEMWSRYNGGRRHHDWTGTAWEQQPSTNSSVTTYAPALLELRRAVDAGAFPAGW